MSIPVKEFLEAYGSIKLDGIDCDMAKLSNVKVEKPNLRGDQIASTCFYYTLDFEFENQKKVHLFAKKIPINPSHAKIAEESNMFQREIDFFNILVPDMKRFCFEKMGSSRLIDDIFPEVYFASGDTILMEDLRFKGFVMLDKVKKQSFQEATMSLKALARFNAVTHGMISRIGVGQFLEKYPFTKEAMLFEGSNKLERVFFEPGLEIIIQMLKESRIEGSDLVLQRLLPYNRRVFQTFVEIFAKDEYLLPVVCHGDFWNSNMMYHLDPNGKVQKVKLLDFTDMRISSPNSDVCNFIFCDVKPEVRNQKWRELAHEYFTELENASKELKSELGFTFEDFLKDFRRYSWYSLLNVVRGQVDVPVLSEFDVDQASDFDNDLRRAYEEWFKRNRDKSDEIVQKIMAIFTDYDCINLDSVIEKEKKQCI